MSIAQQSERAAILPAIVLAPCQTDHYEIVNGQLRELSPMGAFEVVLASELAALLREFAKADKLGVVVVEVLFILDAQRQIQRRPDVAFVSFPRWPDRTVPRANAWNVVPDLAVEIVSPSNTAEEIDGKITDYFQAGVSVVWVLYPESGRVYVYESPTKVKGVERTGELDGGTVLPGLRLAIEKIFAAVTKPS